MRIKLISVGLLAMLGLSACGVGGVEDVEGQAAVTGANQQMLGNMEMQLTGKPIDNPAGPSGDARPQPGHESLPQDPVPMHGPHELIVLPGTY